MPRATVLIIGVGVGCVKSLPEHSGMRKTQWALGFAAFDAGAVTERRSGEPPSGGGGATGGGTAEGDRGTARDGGRARLEARTDVTCKRMRRLTASGSAGRADSHAVVAAPPAFARRVGAAGPRRWRPAPTCSTRSATPPAGAPAGRTHTRWRWRASGRTRDGGGATGGRRATGLRVFRPAPTCSAGTAAPGAVAPALPPCRRPRWRHRRPHSGSGRRAVTPAPRCSTHSATPPAGAPDLRPTRGRSDASGDGTASERAPGPAPTQACTDVQYMQRFAASGISLQHSGHPLVVGAAAGLGLAIRAVMAPMGTTIK